MFCTSETATFLGDVGGTGTFVGLGSVAFEGKLRPGMTGAAAARFEGDVALASSATLELDLGGATRGSEYSALDVGGTVTLDGQIVVRRSGEYVPLPGTRFDVIDAGAIEGTAQIVNATGFPGLTFTPALSGSGDLALDVTGRPGDATLDGNVNFDDLLALARHYNQPADQTWLEGDFDGDGAVAFDDLLALARSYGTSSVSTTTANPAAFAADWALAQSLVPEPTLMLAGLSGAGLLLRRRRRDA